MKAKKPLNVLHIISDTNIGGAGSYLLNFLEFYDRSLLNVRVVCPAGSLLAPRCAAKGVEVIEAAWLPGEQSFQKLNLKEQLKELVYIIRKNRIQVVHTHASFTGRLAAKIAGVKKIIYTKHRLDEIRWWQPKKTWRERMQQLVNDLTCSHVIAVSEAVKENLIQQGVNPRKIAVIYNGIDVAGLRKRAQEGKPPLFPAGWSLPGATSGIIGMAARLEPEKGPDNFVDTAAELLLIDKRAKFVLAGTGSLEKQLKIRAHKLEIGDSVYFAGFQENVAPLLAALDVVVVPSITESFGFSLVEGMALGKPCIASHVGGMPEIVSDWKNGLLVSPYDIREMAKKMLLLLRAPAYAQEIGRRAARTVEEKFDIRLMTAKITELYYES